MALPNEFEEKLITQLRSACRDVLKDMDSDPGDMFLVRWLRARDYDMKRAEQMLRENRRWRGYHKVNSILDGGLDTFFKLNYPLHLGILDKRSRPVVVLPFGRWNLKMAVDHGLTQRFFTYIIQCVEVVMKSVENRDALRKTCAMPITQFTIIVDFDGFQCSQLLNLNVLRMMHQILSTLQSNYPETLAACLCINCPMAVAKTIQCFLVPNTLPFSSSIKSGYSKKAVWHGRLSYDEDKLKAVLRKFVPETEVEKCVYVLSTD